MLSLPDCTDLDQIDLWDEADENLREEYKAECFRLSVEADREAEEAAAEAAEQAKYGTEADDYEMPETRILRPWYHDKAVGPWGPKGPKAKRVTLRSHRTGR